MTSALDSYYSESYPPELWETPAAPVGLAPSSVPADEAPSATSVVAAGARGPGAVETPDGASHVGTLPPGAALLIVAAGTPGSYSPAQAAAQRPRNVTELRQRAQPAAPEPWAAGQYVLVGENGKRAYWDGDTFQRGEAPALEASSDPADVPAGQESADRSIVPDGTVPQA